MRHPASRARGGPPKGLNGSQAEGVPSTLIRGLAAQFSQAEEAFLVQIRALGLPEPTREHRFCERRWRFDLAWPDRLVAVEIEGGVWSAGRHIRPRGFLSDLEKYNTAVSLGWSVYRVTTQMVESGEAAAVVLAALSQPSEPERQEAG